MECGFGHEGGKGDVKIGGGDLGMGDLEQHCQKSVRVECGLGVLTSYEVRSLFPQLLSNGTSTLPPKHSS